MAGYKILIVEDEEAIRSLIQLYLENRKFIVYPVVDGKEALCIVQNKKPDLILLDIEMPQMDGFEVCQKIRKIMNVPIIFISSRRGVTDKVKSFEIGGDDYITKPFDFVELEARINANIRRYSATKKIEQNNILRFNQLEIHLESFECYINGEQIQLSTREMEILIILAKNPNHVWSAESLYDRIWGFESAGDVQTIKVHISNLRKKLNNHLPSLDYIETVRGFGYKFIC
ncbi:response regulator transcription factor [Pseudogracilibacillus auburnensis]|uniref:DNA-binding response OmpR family regulator n=1 Tax=Pseudogracilibacillus auburnensis TaxID=1494959 RepID=A0A2V3VF86_9BACI|nr:response regulator transcription factor [Pseudogracilibacillus auburnensis]MBO1005292.1 response regulator transcription factor [Pseudogracilibacillus auburnensis]PXW80486.1 DNA-binding response OmpR family regulator [Pseudogracilibacillus auburnensis]